MLCGAAAMIDVDALVGLQEASFARAGGGLRSSWPRESAMDAEELRSFLDAHRYCILATATSQAHPVARQLRSRSTVRRFGLPQSLADDCAIWSERRGRRSSSPTATAASTGLSPQTARRWSRASLRRSCLPYGRRDTARALNGPPRGLRSGPRG